MPSYEHEESNDDFFKKVLQEKEKDQKSSKKSRKSSIIDLKYEDMCFSKLESVFGGDNGTNQASSLSDTNIDDMPFS